MRMIRAALLKTQRRKLWLMLLPEWMNVIRRAEPAPKNSKDRFVYVIKSVISLHISLLSSSAIIIEEHWNSTIWAGIKTELSDPSTIQYFHNTQYTDIFHSFNQSTESYIPPFSEMSELKLNTEPVIFFEQTLQVISLTYCAEHSWTDGCWAGTLSDVPQALWPAAVAAGNVNLTNTRSICSSIKWCLNQDIQIWYEDVKKKKKTIMGFTHMQNRDWLH